MMYNMVILFVFNILLLVYLFVESALYLCRQMRMKNILNETIYCADEGGEAESEGLNKNTPNEAIKRLGVCD